MKPKILTIIFSMMLIFITTCDDKGNGSGKKDDTPVFINKTETDVLGIDSIYIAPGSSELLKATTFEPDETPEYQWTSADENIVKIVPTDDLSQVYAEAVGDSGQITTVTVEDIANKGTQTIEVKVLNWPDMEKFIHIGKHGGHHYFISMNKSKWGSAKLECEENGGHLVTFQSQEENDFVNTMNADLRESVWIGLRWNDTLSYTVFNTEWITGEPLEYINWWRPEEGTKYPQEIQNYLPYHFALLNRWGFWENQSDVPLLFVLEIE